MGSDTPSEPFCEQKLIESLRTTFESGQDIFGSIVTTGVGVTELHDVTKHDVL